MKTELTLTSLLAVVPLTLAQPADKPMAKQPPPPVVAAAARPAAAGAYVYEQKPISGLPVLVTPDQAKAVIDRFKEGYKKLGNPRILIYVNRELVDETSGLRLTRTSETSDTDRSETKTDFTLDPNAAKALGANGGARIRAGGDVTLQGGGRQGLGILPGKGTTSTVNERGNSNRTFTNADRPQPRLADKQTVRDVERLFGRPLRHGGATLADQRVATQLIPSARFNRDAITTEGEQASKDRQALSKVADVVLEVLISSRQLVIAEVSGNKVYDVPDIQATAIRLSDAKIIGQASASDILGKDRYAGRVARNFDVREIAEATALTLMEDMMVGLQ